MEARDASLPAAARRMSGMGCPRAAHPGFTLAPTATGHILDPVHRENFDEGSLWPLQAGFERNAASMLRIDRMSVEIEIIVNADYVCLRCTGTCSSVSELKQVFENAIDAARRSHRPKVLIDANGVTGQLTTADRYEGASFLSGQRIGGKIGAIAVVGQEPLIDPARFGETVARNRGVNGRVFSDLDEAISWLTPSE
ncbi:MAG: STAS/SEC14 domain-containing protein [Arenicellales bacterium]